MVFVGRMQPRGQTLTHRAAISKERPVDHRYTARDLCEKPDYSGHRLNLAFAFFTDRMSGVSRVVPTFPCTGNPWATASTRRGRPSLPEYLPTASNSDRRVRMTQPSLLCRRAQLDRSAGLPRPTDPPCQLQAPGANTHLMCSCLPFPCTCGSRTIKPAAGAASGCHVALKHGQQSNQSLIDVVITRT